MKIYLCLVLTLIAAALIKLAAVGLTVQLGPVPTVDVTLPAVISTATTIEPGATVDAIVYEAGGK